MTWQETILAAGSVVFAIALLPAVIGTSKPPIATSLMTGGVLMTFVVCYATLGLWYAAATTFVSGSLWLVLALQAATGRKTE